MWRLVALAAFAVGIGAGAYLVASNTSGWRERQERRAAEAAVASAAHRARRDAGVDECRAKGGVPIVDGWSGWLTRCDFPPVQR